MEHYKSWSGLKKRLEELVCEELKGSISYFLTRYHKVHNSYGRAAIRLAGKELACFSWIELYHQDADLNLQWEQTGTWDYDSSELKEKWDREQTYHDLNFLDSAMQFLDLPIAAALESENFIIRIFAILDRRVGKRTLKAIAEQAEYLSYPQWVRQFYELRLDSAKLESIPNPKK